MEASILHHFHLASSSDSQAMCHFLCRVRMQLGNELFIIIRLCTYVDICIVSRSYGVGGVWWVTLES